MKNKMRIVSVRAAAALATVTLLTVLGAVLHTPARAAPTAAGDAAAGKSVGMKCIVCHTFEAGKNKIGPSLAGIVGRKSGSLPDFNYSPAMKSSNLTWNAATLDRYLTNPRAVVPGTKMIFAGLPAASDRVNLIAYLMQVSPGALSKK